MANNWNQLGDVWSGRDLAEGERVTVNVFDKATQTVLEQTTFVAKAGRLEQFTWVMDLCELVNARLKLIRAGVQVGDKLEIQASGHLNKFWGITERDVQVITTTARADNWTKDKRVNIDFTEDAKVGSTLKLNVDNSKGKLLETVSFKSAPGRSGRGLCAKDFAIEINKTSLYVRAGFMSGQLIDPVWQSGENWIWIPFNADFSVTWSLDESQGWTELGEVWSGRDLAAGERVTVSVFDKATQAMLEQTTFLPGAGRTDQYTWVTDLCEQINSNLKLIRAGDGDNGEWVIRSSGYLNKYWGVTPREIQVVTTTARSSNWTRDKRVKIDLAEDVLVGATLQLKVHNSKGQLLETVNFKSTAGRHTRGLCAKDFATEINDTSLYVRAGSMSGHLIEPVWQAGENWIWIPINADFKVSWSIDLSALPELGEAWSGRDLADGERVTVTVFDKSTQTVLEQTTCVPKAGRLDQYTWVMDLCEQVNTRLQLVRAGVKAGARLEIQGSGYLNKFWAVTDRDVQIVTTTARSNNWTTDKRVNIDITQTIKIGSTLRLEVRNAKGNLLETINFVPSPGRNTGGLCGKDFAIQINRSSAYVRAGRQSTHLIEPHWEAKSNWIWIPFNADISVTWTVDESRGWTELGEVWSGRDLEEGERVTVSVFDKTTQVLLEQTTFLPKAGRLDQYTWIMDLCEQVNADLQLIRAGDGDNGEWVIHASGYRNKYWGITPRQVQVITTAARTNNWTTDKRVEISLPEGVPPGATLQLKVHSTTGALLETVSFKPAPGRNIPGFCTNDFAAHINRMSIYVRAGFKDGSLIQPSAQHVSWIWIPFNADFKVSWSVDLSSLTSLGEVWSGRDLAEGERVTVSVFDTATQTVLEQTTFVPTADRLEQYTWVMDLCAQVNARLQLIRAGVKAGDKLEVQGSGYLNQYWSVTERDVQVITTTARINNWPTDRRVEINLPEPVVLGAILHLKVHTSKGELLETVTFKPIHGRNTRALCAQDFASHINRMSLYVRAGVRDASLIQPSAQHTNWIWVPFNADFKVSWSIDLSALTELNEVWSGRDLVEGERVTVSVFDKATQTVLEQTTFTPKAGRAEQYTWVMDLCEQVNGQLQLVRAGVKAGESLEIQGSGYRNKFWNITDRDVQVITTTARSNNWTTDKRVNIDITQTFKIGSTLRLEVRNAKGNLLETINFIPSPGRNTGGLCGKDFAIQINRNSAYVRAGRQNAHLIEPHWEAKSNWIWIPFNADFSVSWTVDESRGWTELGEVWSGRDLEAGERVTVSVFDKATQTVLEQTTFVPRTARTDQYTWVMDLCEQVNAELQLIRTGDGDNGEWVIRNSGYRNKYWSTTPREVQVITTTARSNNWTAARRVPINLGEDVAPGATLQLKVHNSKGELLESLSFKPADGRNTRGYCGKDFAIYINQTSLYVRAGNNEGELINPSATYVNSIWIPFNADFVVTWSIEPAEDEEECGWSIDLASSLADLGEVWSGRDLAEGERVTISVFDKDLGVLLEQTTFVPKGGHTGQFLWPMEMCRHINANLALIRAGSVDEDGKWDIVRTGQANKYWTWTTRNLEVITTVAHSDNWKTENRVKIDLAKTVAADAVLRAHVRSTSGALLETLTFTPAAGRTAAGPCGQDFAAHVNATSLYLRAGVQDTANTSRIQPSATQSANWLWFPHNAEFTVTWSVDEAKEGCKILADRDALEGERISLFVFDDKADSLLERVTLTARASKSTLAKDKWPAALVKEINATSVHAKASGSVVNSNHMELRLFTTALHLDNWVEAIKIEAKEKLGAGDRIVVKVSTASKGNFCEAVTFTPDPARLEAKQWAHDLAKYINDDSRLLKAGVKDTTKKTQVPTEDATSNVIWIPKDSKLKVAWEKTELKELAPIYLEHDLASSEACQAYVLDDATDTILREMTFTPGEGRTGRYTVPRDLASLINSHTELVRAGEKVGNAVPAPASSFHANKIWSYGSNLRAFTTLNDIMNFDKGSVIGDRDLVENEQVALIVKGKKSGRIFEALTFIPEEGGLGHGDWSGRVAASINERSKFIRAGRENPDDHRIEEHNQAKSNYFWIPKGAGLEVEMHILAGVSWPLPGMTHEAKELFEQCVEGRKYISVDTRTGRGELYIPVAELFADDSFSESLKVGLSHADKKVSIVLGEPGRYVQTQQSYADGKVGLALRDGRVIQLDNSSKFLIGSDFKVGPILGNIPGETHPEVTGYKVAYKDGVEQSFTVSQETFADDGVVTIFVKLVKHVLPSGACLDLEYSGRRLEKISRNAVPLVEIKWVMPAGSVLQGLHDTPLSIVVFGKGTSDKKTYSFSKKRLEDTQTTVQVDGFSTSGKILYTVSENEAGKLSGLEVSQQHGFVVDKKEKIDKATYSEVLQYNSKGMVCSHIISPGDGMDELVQDYVYSAESTALTSYYKTASPRSTFVRQFDFLDHHTVAESHGSAAMPYSKRRSQRLDTTEKQAITETCIWEGDVLVDRQALSVDAVGNPVERINNEEITRWTYYNNYQQFFVTETEVKVEDWSLFGCLFKAADYTVAGAVFAIGGNGGMTWGTRIDTKVEMKLAVNDYAQKTFNLPVAIVHCGSDKPFSGEAESELVLRKVGDKEVPQRLTFYGYANVDDRIRAKQKLTILQPDCSQIDVTDVQLKIATKAAEPFTESLEKQIAGSSGDVKKAFEQTLKELKKSLKAQSEANCKGYKLNTMRAASMALETYDYHTEKDKPGYGTVKSSELVLLDLSGAAIEGSRVKTEYEYSLDPADTNKLIIKTTVSRGEKEKVVSSQTRSRLSGRLLGSTDTEGTVTVRTYDPQGNLTSEKVTDADKNTRETTCTLARGLVWQYDMVQDGTTTRIERDMLGRKVAEAVKPDGKFLETRRWTFDSMGRVASCVETDYGPADAKVAIRESNREYDAQTGTVSISNLLKDGSGKKINEIKQEQTPLPRGERFTQGAFTMERQYSPNKRIMTELHACAGMDSGKIERIMSAEGLTQSVRHLTIDAEKTETEQDKQAYEYDGYGQLTKVTPKFGGAFTYTYDSVGRLRSSQRDGICLTNAYEPTTFAPVAGESSIESGDSEYELGKQGVDLLGRVVSQTVAGRKTEFKYTGASKQAVLKTAVTGPTALSDYEPSHDKKTRTLTQKLGGKTSTVVFSTGGQVLSFTDLTGAKTTYEYDFFNRLTKSSNDHCVCTWTYLDNGLLGQETITAVKADNLKMTVTYGYNGLGQETRRVFNCAGVDKMELERTLLGDGRLKKNVLQVAGKEKYVDTYEYDNSLRLLSWSETNRPEEAMQLSRWGTWTYDALGNVIKRTDPVSLYATVFEYDDDNKEQLKNLRHFMTSDAEPKFDGTAAWEYDSAGRMIKDPEGNTCSYYENGQVKNYRSVDIDYTFSYDTEGRVRGGQAGTVVETYHYCGDRLYAKVEVVPHGDKEAYKRSLVLRNESRACLMQDTDTNGELERSFELRDASGTVFASVDLTTKAITYFRYGPYGERHEGEHSNNWLGFKGEPINVLGLYHLGNGYRLYDPALGRFLTRDNKSPFSIGGAAAYVFGNADPVNHGDPSGRAVVAEYSRWKAAPAIQSTAFRVVVGAVGVLLAPFTAGTSILLAMATTALAAISFAFDMASLIISESDPQLSKTLEAWGQAFGLASAASGIAMGLHGLKGLPRNWFRTRGTPLSKVKANWPTVPSELRFAQEARAKALAQLVQNVDEAKAAGKFEAFKATYLNNSTDAAGGLFVSGGFKQQITTTSRNLYKGSVTHCDDMLFDWVGYTLDLNASINMLVQKFNPPMVSEAEIKSMVALPLPGMENLFK